MSCQHERYEDCPLYPQLLYCMELAAYLDDQAIPQPLPRPVRTPREGLPATA